MLTKKKETAASQEEFCSSSWYSSVVSALVMEAGFPWYHELPDRHHHHQPTGNPLKDITTNHYTY